jgi:transitional endoplasmic reticulum ATPase
LIEWNALILPQETKDALLTYCDMLRNYSLYTAQGISLPRGLMFYGPPGCGKTETARFLSRRAGFAFVSLSSADLKVGWIGQAAVAIQNAFKKAREQAPCMIYIDEIDASCPTRTAGHNSVIDSEVVAQLLQELDGLNTTDNRPVFVFASTNRMDMIDPAILQRFTEYVEIKLPTSDERMQLLNSFIGRIPFENLNTPRMAILARISFATYGFSGRELKSLVTRSTMKALQRSAKNGGARTVILRESDFVL